MSLGIRDNVRDKVIAVLEKAKHEHYTDRSGLGNCDGIVWDKVKNCYVEADFAECTCGAKAINDEIDAMIHELRILYGDSRVAPPTGILRT